MKIKKFYSTQVTKYIQKFKAKPSTPLSHIMKIKNVKKLVETSYQPIRQYGVLLEFYLVVGFIYLGFNITVSGIQRLPFNPLKIVSFLALNLGKCRSKIHAWQNPCLAKNIRHQSDWSKVSLYLPPSFLSKNQLANDRVKQCGPNSS